MVRHFFSLAKPIVVVRDGSSRDDANVLVIHDVSGCSEDNEQTINRREQKANGGALSSRVVRVIGDGTAQQRGRREPGPDTRGLAGP